MIHARLDWSLSTSWVPAITVTPNSAIKMNQRALNRLARLALGRALFDLLVVSSSLTGFVFPIDFMIVGLSTLVTKPSAVIAGRIQAPVFETDDILSPAR